MHHRIFPYAYLITHLHFVCLGLESPLWKKMPMLMKASCTDR